MAVRTDHEIALRLVFGSPRQHSPPRRWPLSSQAGWRSSPVRPTRGRVQPVPAPPVRVLPAHARPRDVVSAERPGGAAAQSSLRHPARGKGPPATVPAGPDAGGGCSRPRRRRPRRLPVHRRLLRRDSALVRAPQFQRTRGCLRRSSWSVGMSEPAGGRLVPDLQLPWLAFNRGPSASSPVDGCGHDGGGVAVEHRPSRMTWYTIRYSAVIPERSRRGRTTGPSGNSLLTPARAFCQAPSSLAVRRNSNPDAVAVSLRSQHLRARSG
jgi:hypothetical protein